MSAPEQRRALGASLELRDGDLVLEPGPGGARLARVEGRPNLLQALELRVLTPYGSDRFNILYGVDYAQVFGSEAGRRTTQELVRLNLVRALATDPRVADVREVVFLADDAARRGRTWRVEVVLETADGEELTLPLGIGG